MFRLEAPSIIVWFNGTIIVYCYYPVLIMGYIVHVLVLVFVWYPCMAMNDNVNVQYNGGLLPDIILLKQCYYLRETRLNAIKRFCICNL